MIKKKIDQFARNKNMNLFEYLKYMEGIELAIDNFNFKFEDIENRFKNNTISEIEYYSCKNDIYNEILSYSDATEEYINLINSLNAFDKSINTYLKGKINTFIKRNSENESLNIQNYNLS
ncbi:hypothetical protein ACFL20_04370 [Spirochaetota bacterium]